MNKKFEEIKQDRSKFEQFKRAIDEQVRKDFNFIRLSAAEKVFENDLYAQTLSPSDAVLCEDFFDTVTPPAEAIKEFIKKRGLNMETGKKVCCLLRKEFCEWFVDSPYFSGIKDDIRSDWENTRTRPVFGTLYEPRSSGYNNVIFSKIDEIYDIGLGIIDESDFFNALLFIPNTSGDFVTDLWIPFYKLIFPELFNRLVEEL